ncbi:class I SAM-dependent methyltransferase [Acidaminobacter sp. JC074]|uniref:class I SAM-dependent methyltransferase n=1 Tax=Acidaminobacter sp. JC074 TaxID=2530199 RepID=UPI001F0FE881|nr:class I SAM-dependent methyltransferase [Acidaminobacter sp. JC074]MCH4890832.1 class I SAM-dependent methyltransferase [Acidaminobacter sp. JC074]
MNFYNAFMSVFEKGELGQVRKNLMKLASGHVLEIGVGTGVNLSYYDYDAIDKLTLTDLKLSPLVETRLSENVEFVEADVQDLPFKDMTFDTVVISLVFCSVRDVNRGLSEIKRVLKSEGKIIFIEHVRPELSPLDTLSDAVTPLWRKMASNCHLNRDFLESLNENGFDYSVKSRFNKTAFVAGIGNTKAT